MSIGTGLKPVTRGIMYMIAASALISANDAAIKVLITQGFHSLEVVFFRNLFGVLAFLPFYWRLGLASLRTERFGFHLLKNLLQSISICAYFWALGLISLADAAALGFMQPIFSSAGAILFMGERSRMIRWACIVIGMVGMLILLAPGMTGTLNLGTILVIGATVVGACVRLMTKNLIRTDSASTIVIYLSVTVTVLTFIPSLFVWVWPNVWQWMLFVAIGASGSACHWLMTEALKHGDVTAIEPMNYTRLVWAAFFGIVIFGNVPGLATWVGGAIIITGAILLLRVETREKQRIS
jgi:drug/metabolite transporter (DMT)-like permease